jgi:aspartate kinase
MSLLVQKYGGTSVGSVERIQQVAEKVSSFRAQGHDMVVVVSAMSGETNRLIALAKEIQETPDPRELDVLVSTGEQVTIALLCMALKKCGVEARSYTGGQVRILTDSAFTKARIQSIDEANIRADLKAGRVVVVAGFQGVDDQGNITTLGRGGRFTPMLMVFIQLIRVFATEQNVSTKLHLKKCWKWPVRAQKFCKFVRLSLLENIKCPCAYYTVSKKVPEL